MCNKSILESFDEIVKDFPDKLAVKFEEKQSLTYGELDKLINKIVFLLEKKVEFIDHQAFNNDTDHLKPIVPIFIAKSVYSVASIFAILKIGCAFVFIEKNTPKKRLKYLLKQINASVMIDDDFITELENLDKISKNPINKRRYIKNNDLAMICFTSGSTGSPKGVMINMEQLQYSVNAFSEEVFNTYSAKHFLYISEFYFFTGPKFALSAIKNKVSFYIVSDNSIQNTESFVKYIKQNKIDISFFPPQFTKIFLQYADGVLKTIITGGDKVSNIHSDKTTILNIYGTTETLGSIISFKIDKIYRDTPIGKPLSGVDVYLLDENLKDVRKGNIHVARIIALGYLNDEKLTREKFIPNPYSKSDNDKILYKTDDLAYLNSDDDLVYLQRKGFMINAHGYRVEPTEVEDAINSIKGIKESVVAGFDVSNLTKIDNDTIIYAGIITEKKYSQINTNKIKKELSNLIPSYMIPLVIEKIDSIPLNRRGKIDRKNIVPMNIEEIYLNNTDDKIGEQENDISIVEEELLTILKNIVLLTNLSTNTDLVSIGLHSILQIEFAKQIYQKYSIDILENNLLKDENFTISNIAKLIKNNEENELIVNYKKEKDDYYPLKKNQLGIYLEQIKKQTIEYNIPILIKIQKSIDIRDLIEKLFYFHPYLNSTIKNKNDKILLKRRKNNIRVETISINEETLEDKIKDLIKPFTLEDDSNLYRIHVIETNENNYLFLDINHILFDGASIHLFIKTMNKILNKNNEIRVDDLAFYSNYLENKKINSKKYKEQVIFYRDLLKNIDSVTELLDKNTSNNHDGDGKVLVSIDKKKIDLFCEDNKISESNLLLAVYLYTISKYSLQEDILISTIVSSKTPIFEDSVGMFANTLPFPITINTNDTIEEFLQEVKNRTMNINNNNLYSVLDLKEDYGYQTTIAYNYRHNILNTNKIMNKEIKGFIDFTSDNFNYSFDLILNIDSINDEYRLEFLHSNKYSNEIVKSFTSTYQNVLEYIISTEDIMNKIKNIEFIPGKDEELLLNELNNTYIDNNSDNKTIIDLFEEQVQKKPDYIALVYKDTKLTYHELNAKVNRLTNYLTDNKLIDNSSSVFVPLVFDRSLHMIISILSVIKCGCAYVPISPDNPVERTKHILKDTEAKIILTDNNSYESVVNLSKTLNSVDVVNIEELFTNNKLVNVSSSDLDVKPSLNDLVYLIYTSGTTGYPKGVMIKHKGAYNRLIWLLNEFNINHRDRILHKTTYTFDVSLWEIILPLLAGATQIIAEKDGEKDPRYLIDLMSEEKITLVNFVPSMLVVFLQTLQIYKNKNDLDNPLPYLNHILISGESLDLSIVNDFKMLSKNTNVYNIYGPAEGGLTYFDCNKNNLTKIPIGKPIYNVTSYILDNNQKLLPFGAVGELYIGGDDLAKGYLNNEKLTKEKFTPNPYQTKEQKENNNYNDRLYKTGDLVRLNKGGDLEYIGRVDHQVKLRGYRIELGEIENTITKILSIKQAIVIVNNNDKLVAYYQGEKIPNQTIIDTLSDSLPGYMIPVFYEHLDEIPLNNSGKVDRKKLSIVDTANILTNNKKIIMPKNSLVKQLADIFSTILSIDIKHISINSNFFELGGNSILAMALTNEIRQTLNEDITVASIFENNTVERIANLITKNYYDINFKPVRAFNIGDDDKPRLIFMPPAHGGSEAYYKFFSFLDKSISFYAFDNYNLKNFRSPIRGVENMAKKYIEYLEKENLIEDDNFILGGWSYGGVIAYEMARQLKKKHNIRTKKLLLFDPFIPDIDSNQQNIEDYKEEIYAQNRKILLHGVDESSQHFKPLLDILYKNEKIIRNDMFDYAKHVVDYEMLDIDSVFYSYKYIKEEDKLNRSYNGFKVLLKNINGIELDVSHVDMFVDDESIFEIMESINILYQSFS
ncbi:MAG: amino acid adenylation domain-containing protein [Methanobrevibacter sp.]|jgi:amino acid adenylation domain-containing protein|nr:amino acid adenylation domain-containing protein [Candidatus Methanovirga basalitermitum]